MIQTYSLILWAGPQRLSLDEMVELSYSLLLKLKLYGKELSPAYLTVIKKNQAKGFDLSRENIRELLEKSVNREGKMTFEDLGRSFSFFSSLHEDKSCGISLTIGANNKVVTNSLVVNLPHDGFSGFSERTPEFELLFKQLIQIFKPYWGCVCNKRNNVNNNYNLWNVDRPITVHWLNYFDHNTTKSMNRKKVCSLKGIEVFANGYYYKLQEAPINVENQMHLELQKEVNMRLGLL